MWSFGQFSPTTPSHPLRFSLSKKSKTRSIDTKSKATPGEGGSRIQQKCTPRLTKGAMLCCASAASTSVYPRRWLDEGHSGEFSDKIRAELPSHRIARSTATID